MQAEAAERAVPAMTTAISFDRRMLRVALPLLAAATLAGCVVVPVPGPGPGRHHGYGRDVVVVPPAPAPVPQVIVVPEDDRRWRGRGDRRGGRWRED